MNKKMRLLFGVILIFTVERSMAQLNISGAQFFIESGAEVTVQGDLISNTDILGPGKIILNGTGNQNINTGGFTIPNLEINNSANATLVADARIGKSILFTNGKIATGNFNLNLADTATASGMGAGKFVETNGTGQVIKQITANITSYEVPVGAGTDYRPAFITTSGTYSNANVGVKVLTTASSNNPPSLSDYIKAYWPITRTGVTGTVTVAARYADADINANGRKDSLKGYYFNGTDWNSAGETHNAPANLVSAPIVASGELSAMDKFDLINARAFLQGAYLGGGLMSDNLRTTGAPATSLIPLADPYRITPYNATFLHVNNSITETASATVFADQPQVINNIVDWVFIELRNNAASPGNTVLQTRSAFIQRDGDIVDVDGTSAVTFNNTASGNYTIAIRHRNHLGIATDPLAFNHFFGEAKSGALPVDFSTVSETQIFGTSTAFKVNPADNVNMLWAGDADFNRRVKYGGSTNDPNAIQTQVLTFPGNPGSYTFNNAIGYFSGDINMDRRVKFAGGTNDVNLILTNIINYPSNTSGSYTFSAFNQQIPN